ncbi:MAG TPA: cupin domain-containing protein [Halococcus sp.]|nr:cupin domain-containing protein [Halococcus sp.]
MPVHEDDIDWSGVGPGSTGFRRKQLGAAAGGERLGCSLYELPAGEQAWPYHYHAGNEEALFVLSGTGTLRLAGEHHPLSSGTYVALPTGEEGGHRVVNDSDEVLRYLVISTMNDPDVTVYPDSATFGVYAGSPPGGDEDDRILSGYFRQENGVDYWEDVVDE